MELRPSRNGTDQDFVVRAAQSADPLIYDAYACETYLILFFVLLTPIELCLYGLALWPPRFEDLPPKLKILLSYLCGALQIFFELPI